VKIGLSALVLVPSLVACGGRELAPPSSAPPPAAGGPSTAGHTWRIAPAESRVVVHVASSGLVGHDHHFVPQRWSGIVRFDPAEPAAAGVEMTFSADALRDEQPKISEEDRKSKVEPTARGPEVLDAARYPEVRFIGRRIAGPIDPADTAGRQSLRGTLVGTLVLHGRQREVSAPLIADWKDGRLHAVGEATILQTDYGIEPMRRMLGIVAVKDAVKVSFDLVATRDEPPP
jgi:polyisoprenoid-binding protein YceI